MILNKHEYSPWFTEVKQRLKAQSVNDSDTWTMNIDGLSVCY